MTPHRIVHVHDQYRRERTFGQRIADVISNGMGSWPFLIIQSAFIAAWMVLNVLAFVSHWDPRPWIILNLLFSIQAAYAAPIILMSQKRQDEIDRRRDDADYHTDLHGAETADEILIVVGATQLVCERILARLEAQDDGR